MEEIINQLQNLRDLVSEKEKVDNEISHLESNKSAYENVAKKAQDTINRLMQEFNEGKLIDQSLLINARKEIEENTKSIKATEKDIDENIELLNKKFQDSKDELVEKIDEEMARYKRKSELDQLRSNKFAYEKVAENAQKTIEKIMQEFNQGKIIDQSLLVNARKEVEENTKKAEEIGKELDGYIELESNIEQYTELEYLKTRTIVLQIEDLKPDLESKFIENNIKEDNIEKQSNKKEVEEVKEEEQTVTEEGNKEEKGKEPDVVEKVSEEGKEETDVVEKVGEEGKEEPTVAEEVGEEEKKEEEPTATEEVDEEEKEEEEPTATEEVGEEEKEEEEPTVTEEVTEEPQEENNAVFQNNSGSEQEVDEFDITEIRDYLNSEEDNNIEKSYNKKGYDNTKFNKEGKNEKTGDIYDEEGFDIDGYDKDGYDKNGFNREGIHRVTNKKYNENGFDKFGFDENGIHKDTGIEFAPMGFDRNGTPWRVFLKRPEGKQVLRILGITENDIDNIDFEEFIEAYKNPTLKNKKEKIDILEGVDKEETQQKVETEKIVEQDVIKEKPEQQLKVVKENLKDKIIKTYNKAVKKIQESKIASLVKGLFNKPKKISQKTDIPQKSGDKKEIKKKFKENLSQEQSETYIKPKYENISEKDKKSILDRLDIFSSQIDNNYEYDETVSGYIADKAFESFVSDNEYVKSTVIVTDDKLVQIDINKEDNDIGKYKEIKQKDEETKVTFYSDMQASEIITTMEKGNIKLTNTAKEILYSDDMPEFYTYSIPKDIDKNTYVTVTGLEEEEDLYRLLEGSFAISTEAEKNVDGITKNKTVKYLYTSKQAYINKEKPYMIYVENVDNRQKNAGMFRLLEDGTYIDNNTFTTDGNMYDYETLSLEEINNLIDKENIQIELTSKMDKTIKEGFSIPKEYADIIETARKEESNKEIQFEQK